ncbi:MAG: hypothetical protein V7750_17685 [Sneathiella sp.]
MNRRKFIKTIGSTGLVVAASGFGLSQCDQMPNEAVQAWQGPAQNLTDREWILSYALLAPNPHNMQPWLADLREEDTITLHIDGDRLLPHTDPYGRQILIGQGTFLELLSIAAKERGYKTHITLFPDGAPDTDSLNIHKKAVARIELIKNSTLTKDPLFSAILARRSNKTPYREEYLSQEHIENLSSLEMPTTQSLSFAATEKTVAPHKKFAERAMLLEMETPRTLMESIDRTRIGADEIRKNPDGIDLHGPMFWWLKNLGMMTPEKASKPGTFAYQGGIDYALGWVEGTFNMGWLTTSDNSREAQVNAGRSYVRLNLLATQLGVSMHPVSQILQEYPEMRPLQDEFNEHVGVKAEEKVQMYFRIGYQKRPNPSPRRKLTDITRA